MIIKINNVLKIVDFLRSNKCVFNSGETRNDMTKFWESHSHNASIEEMMLDTNASLISQEELPEVMALLPELKGKNVLELGGGIG